MERNMEPTPDKKSLTVKPLQTPHTAPAGRRNIRIEPAPTPTASLEVNFAIRLTGFRLSSLSQMLQRLIGW